MAEYLADGMNFSGDWENLGIQRGKFIGNIKPLLWCVTFIIHGYQLGVVQEYIPVAMWNSILGMTCVCVEERREFIEYISR